MANDRKNVSTELTKFVQALWFDLPQAMIARAANAPHSEKAAYEAAWKAYDSWMRLADSALNEWYRNPLLGQSLGAALELGLRSLNLIGSLAPQVFGATDRNQELASPRPGEQPIRTTERAADGRLATVRTMPGVGSPRQSADASRTADNAGSDIAAQDQAQEIRVDVAA